MRWRRFVALGDSFTEGLDDPYPDGGVPRLGGTGRRGARRRWGWDGSVGGGRRRRGDDLQLREPGDPGAALRPGGDEQVPAALVMRPELISFAAGGNDVLRPKFDGPALMARFDSVVAGCVRPARTCVLFRFADMRERLPARRLVRSEAGAAEPGRDRDG